MTEEEVTAVENKVDNPALFSGDDEETSVSETEEEVTQSETPRKDSEESIGIPSEGEVTQFQEEILGLSSQRRIEINIVKNELTALKDVLESKANTEALQVVKEQIETLGLSAKRIETIETLNETVQERLETETNKRDELQQKTEGQIDDLTTGFGALNKTVREIVDVVKPKDEAARTINPAAVPPVVLQETYENIATDVFQQMVQQYGSTAAVSRVEAVVEYVRKSSAGMEFFEVSDNQRITAPGLANAIRRKLMSPHQLQITFTEFLRNLLGEVPDYQPLSLRSLTETGSQEYAVAEVTKLVEQTAVFGDSLSTIQKSLTETNAKIEALSSRIEKLESAVSLKTEE